MYFCIFNIHKRQMPSNELRVRVWRWMICLCYRWFCAVCVIIILSVPHTTHRDHFNDGSYPQKIYVYICSENPRTISRHTFACIIAPRPGFDHRDPPQRALDSTHSRLYNPNPSTHIFIPFSYWYNIKISIHTLKDKIIYKKNRINEQMKYICRKKYIMY